MDVDSRLWNFDVIRAFKENLTGNSFSKHHISKEISIKKEGYLQFSKNHKDYLLDLELEDKLPIQALEEELYHYKNKIFHKITNAQSIKIKEKKTLSFDELVFNFANFKHTNNEDWTLWRLITLASFFTRLNLRIATKPHFGKNSTTGILAHFTEKATVFHPRSMAAVEYRLGTRLMAIDEVGTVATANYYEFQDFLLLAGDLRPQYEKPTRGNKAYGTRDVYNISNMSLILMYNDIPTYAKADPNFKKSYFDFCMNGAVHNRFLPIKLKGSLYSEQFSRISGLEEARDIAHENKSTMIELLQNLEYYQNNWYKELKQKQRWDFTVPKLLDNSRRYGTFLKLGKFLNLFEDDKDLLSEYLYKLWNKVKDYYAMVDKVSTKETGLSSFMNEDNLEYELELKKVV